MQQFIEKLSAIRVLCSSPSGIPGKGSVALKGLAPAEHISIVGLSLVEIVRWLGADTPVTGELMDAVSALTGETRSTFGKLIWASHRIERTAFVRAVTELDNGRTRKGKPVTELRDHELRREVISRRIALMGAIEKLGGKVDSDLTAAELLVALDRAHQAQKLAKAREAEKARCRKLAAANREDYGRFKSAQLSGFRGNFDQFRAFEARKRAERKRERQGLPPRAPAAVVQTAETNEAGETKVVETKVRSNPVVVQRRRSAGPAELNN